MVSYLTLSLALSISLSDAISHNARNGVIQGPARELEARAPAVTSWSFASSRSPTKQGSDHAEHEF